MPNETVTEPTEAEVTTEETTETEPTEAPETSTSVTSELLNSDAFIDRVADAVAGRVERFASSLIEASQNAVAIAEQMTPIDNSAPPTEEPEAPAEDVAPQRRHRLFGQPLKRREQ